MKKIILKVSVLFCVSIVLQAKESSFPVYVYNTLLGAVSKGKFIGAKEAYKIFKDTKDFPQYMLYGKEGIVKEQLSLTAVRKEKDILSQCVIYTVKGESDQYESFALPENLSWNPQERKLRPQLVNIVPYKKYVVNFLNSKGIDKTPLMVREQYSIDLDGDGEEEIVIVASESKNNPILSYDTFRSKNADFGDYVYIAILKKKKHTYDVTLVAGAFFNHDIEYISNHSLGKYSIYTTIDINGDGRMELIIHKSYHESGFTEVYEYMDGKVKKVLFEVIDNCS